MPRFPVKLSQQENSRPQQPSAAFLPQYEEAVNNNLRNFDQLEGQVGKETYDHTGPQNRKKSALKMCLLFGLPIMLVFMLALGAAAFVLDQQQTSSTTPEPVSASHASVTVSQRDAYTSFVTQVITVAESVSDYSHMVPTLGLGTFSSVSTLPAVSMSSSSASSVSLVPTSSATTFATSTFAPPLTLTSAPSSTTSTSLTSRETTITPPGFGDGFCGLPGSACIGGRDLEDVDGRDADQADA